MTDTLASLRSAPPAPAQRATRARSGRRSLIALLAVAGGGCAIAGAALPWLTVYQGLDSYNGLAGMNGQMLAAGGSAAALLGFVYGVRPASAVRYLIGGLGFLLALLAAYLIAQLLSIYRELHGIFLPALGPGVFLGAAGALMIFATLFVNAEPGVAAHPRIRNAQRFGPVTASLVALSAGAGTIHLTIAADHFGEYVLFGLFFVVAGVAQVAWAAIVSIAGPRDRLMTLSLANALIVVLWVASRTTGVPIGPNSGVPEPVGYADVVTTVFECALVGMAVVLLLRRSAVATTRSAVLWSIPLLVTPAAVLAVLSAVGAIGFPPASG